jgi:hypothetical protein
MKLTTARLKKLIREELERMNENNSMSGQTKDGKEFKVSIYKAGSEKKGRLEIGDRDQNYSVNPDNMSAIADTLKNNDLKKALSDLNLGRARPDKDFVNYIS